MSQIRFYNVSELPETPKRNSLYIIEDDESLTFNFVDSAGNVATVPAGGGGGALQYVTKTFTDAQIKAMPVDSYSGGVYEMVAAQGAGKLIVPIFATYALHGYVTDYTDNNGTPFANPDGNKLYLTWNNNSIVAVEPTVYASSLLTAGGVNGVVNVAYGDGFAAQDNANNNLVMAADSAGGLPFIGGDSGTTLVVSVSYVVMDV